MPAPPAIQPPGARSRTSFRSARLLAIDDSPTYLEHVTEELRSQGYEVETAASGIDGLEKLAHRTFDCVLVDLAMPGMNGIEVCRRITELRRTRERPVGVIMLTSRETKEDMAEGLQAGADDFVGKSSDLTVLKARLLALLGRARADREAAVELSRANQELEEANQKLRVTQMHLIQGAKMASLGRLVAGIAHEINNPLAFVMNNLFTVEEALVRIDPEITLNFSDDSRRRVEKMRARLADMKQGLDRVKELVLNLRTFSRLDEGEFKTIDIHESIDSALLFLRHKMTGRIQLEKQYGSPGALPCYARRLNQVLLNLISNAVDAIENQGKITIATSQAADNLVISVRDTGSGIPEAIRSRIFEPFFTTKPEGQGTGLGLAIAYGIVQAHHGVIEVASEEGEGTQFTVRLPVDLKAPATQQVPQRAVADSGVPHR